jgi:hypothetical protein
VAAEFLVTSLETLNISLAGMAQPVKRKRAAAHLRTSAPRKQKLLNGHASTRAPSAEQALSGGDDDSSFDGFTSDEDGESESGVPLPAGEESGAISVQNGDQSMFYCTSLQWEI